jgi:hypothetical protein
MIIEKKASFRPIFESSEGVHLTSYLVNRGDLEDLRDQLQETMRQSSEWLIPVMTLDERQRFLEPLESLLADSQILEKMKGNIGIFRSHDSFRLLNIPIEVEPLCHVATSFHVKPLLRWLQMDVEFLLLGLEKDTARLYLGSQSSFRLIDSALLPESLRPSAKAQARAAAAKPKKNSKLRRSSEEETFAWLNDWISELTKTTKPKLFIAGEPNLVSRLNRRLNYKKAVKTPVAHSFGKHNVSEISGAIRGLMKAEAQESLEKSLFEFRLAEEDNRVQKNIFQISRAVVKGKVRKLLVTDEINIFGKIDRTSGGIAIHPFDLDHEDDDLLDDLAQMVLSQGGEVIVASKDQIPKGRPILAILDDQCAELEKAEQLRQSEIFQERLA